MLTVQPFQTSLPANRSVSQRQVSEPSRPTSSSINFGSTQKNSTKRFELALYASMFAAVVGLPAGVIGAWKLGEFTSERARFATSVSPEFKLDEKKNQISLNVGKRYKTNDLNQGVLSFSLPVYFIPVDASGKPLAEHPPLGDGQFLVAAQQAAHEVFDEKADPIIRQQLERLTKEENVVSGEDVRACLNNDTETKKPGLLEGQVLGTLKLKSAGVNFQIIAGQTGW